MTFEQRIVRSRSLHDDARPHDGHRVLITRFWPRGKSRAICDAYCPELGPTKELLDEWKSKCLPWTEFLARLKAQYLADPKAKKTIWELHQKSFETDITLMCHERDGHPCHRHFLRRVIANPAPHTWPRFCRNSDYWVEYPAPVGYPSSFHATRLARGQQVLQVGVA